MHQLAPQEQEIILMRLKDRLEGGRVESVYYVEGVYYIHYLTKENLRGVRYIFDMSTKVRSLTVITIYGEHTITESPKNTKIFQLLSRCLLRVSTFSATENHDKLMKILTD